MKTGIQRTFKKVIRSELKRCNILQISILGKSNISSTSTYIYTNKTSSRCILTEEILNRCSRFGHRVCRTISKILTISSIPSCSNQIHSLWRHTDWIKPSNICLLQITTIHDNLITQQQHQAINKYRNIALLLSFTPFDIILRSVVVFQIHTLIISKRNIHQFIRQDYIVPINPLCMRQHGSRWKFKHRIFT